MLHLTVLSLVPSLLLGPSTPVVRAPCVRGATPAAMPTPLTLRPPLRPRSAPTMRGGEHSQGEAELEALMEEKLAAESTAARDPTAISAMVAHAEADAKALKESNPELADRTGTLKEKLFKALNKPAKSLALIGEGTAVQGQATLGGYDLNECKYLSAQFREGSCAAVSVRIGDDDSLEADALELTCAEQETQRGEFPGPLPVIARGCFLERIQLAQCAAQGASAVMLTLAQTGKEILALARFPQPFPFPPPALHASIRPPQRTAPPQRVAPPPACRPLISPDALPGCSSQFDPPCISGCFLSI